MASAACVVLFATLAHAVAPPAVPGQAASAATVATKLTHPIFVLNSLDADVSIIDPNTWTETQRIPTGKEPHHLYLTPDEKSLIVANSVADSLTFLDPRTAQVQRTVRGISDPYQLRFSPDMKWFVTAANRLNHVDIYRWDGQNLTLAKRIATGKTPSHLWIDSKSTTIYSSMQDSDELIAIDLATQTVKWRTPTGAMPADVFVTADDKTLLLGLTGSDGVEVYDVSGKAPVRTRVLPTGKGAHAFRARVDALAQRHANVKPLYVYDTPRDTDTPHATGFVTRELLAGLLPEDRDVDLYFLGPKPFMKAVYASGLALGVPRQQLRCEFFGPLEALEA